MADSKGIRAGKAYVEVFADSSKLRKGIKLAEADFRAFGMKLQTIGRSFIAGGTAIFAPLIASTKIFSSMGDEIAKMSKRTGIGVETLSQWKVAADMAGTNIESLEGGVKKLSKNLYEAAEGTGEARDAIMKLGLDAKTLVDMAPEKAFALIAEKVKGIQNPVEKAAIAMQLFGKSGTDLLPLFEELKGGSETAKKFNLTISPQDARLAEETNDALSLLWMTVKKAAFQIGAALAPAVKEMATRISESVAAVIKWISENRPLINQIATIAAMVVAGGAAIYAFGTAFTFLAGVIAKVMVVFKGLATVFTLIKTAIIGLFSPFGLLLGVITAGSAAWLYYSGNGRKALDWLTDRVSTLVSDIRTAFGAIGKALAKGDIGLAAQILWLTLKMEFLKGKQFILEIWFSFKAKLLEYWYSFTYGMVGAFHTACYGIKVAWIELVSFLTNLWNGFKSNYNNVIDGVAKKFLQISKWVNEKAGQKQWAQDNQAMIDELDRDTKRRQAGELQQRMARDTSKDAALGIAKDQYNTSMSATGQALAEKLAPNPENDAKIREIEQQIAEVTKSWKEAIGKANLPETKMPTPTPTDPYKTDLVAKMSSVGTFSAQALQGLGAASPFVRTATACEETAKNTRTLKNGVGSTFI